MMAGANSARDRLERAYFELIEQTHYSKITVSDIIRKVGISRTTFYRHYVDIFDMHRKIADRLASSIIKECAMLVLSSHGDEDYFEGILKIFNTQEKYIILISGKNGSRYFFEAMLRNAYEIVSGSKLAFDEDQLFRLRFMTGAMIGIYIHDIIDGREHNPNYIKICKKLLNSSGRAEGYYAGKY